MLAKGVSGNKYRPLKLNISLAKQQLLRCSVDKIVSVPKKTARRLTANEVIESVFYASSDDSEVEEDSSFLLSITHSEDDMLACV